jgi:hypothetical protein
MVIPAGAHNRKLPPLPDPSTIAADDDRQWAIALSRARALKGWSYLTLSTHCGVCTTAVIRACTRGIADGRTLLRIAVALDIRLQLPQPVSAQEAQHGRRA